MKNEKNLIFLQLFCYMFWSLDCIMAVDRFKIDVPVLFVIVSQLNNPAPERI